MNSTSKDSKPKVLKLPTVQLIGAQKAGTSAVADWLFEEGGFSRPRVFDGEPWYFSKETHFFDSGQRYAKGVEFYAKRFETENQCGRTLDATPDTLPFAERVQSTYEATGVGQDKTVKIIVILREPVSRELSLYNHLAFDCRNLSAAEKTEWHHQATNDDGGSILSFDEFVVQRSIPALCREIGPRPGQSTRHSKYASHLKKWFELFDRNQILVLSYDELQHHPVKVQERIQEFLGFKIPGELKRSNSNDSKHKVRLPTKKSKQALLSVMAPLNKELYQLLEANPGPPMEQSPFPRFRDPPSAESPTSK